jgi:3-hydroxy-9,10-secoandrosta-1,3,5(10)-triene-9,17-dione monooxygenase
MNHTAFAPPAIHPPIGSTEEVVQRARDMIPVLRDRAGETETLRRLPDATREDITRTGIHRVLQPARFGGTESGFRAAVDILCAVGKGCGSTAWVLAQNIAHNFMLAQWPDEAQRAVWGENPAAMLSGILIPGIGRARAVEGGYVLSGRWPWLSGVDVCDWALFTAFVPDANGRQEDRHFVIPRHQFHIHDTWHAMGLKGSSSNDVSVDEVFVPAHMTVTVEDLKGGTHSPGSAYNDALVFRGPCYAMFGVVIGSAALGIAEAAVEHYMAHARRRTAAMSGGAVVSYTTQHVKVAQAATEVAAARLLMYGVCDDAMAILETGRLPTDEERTRFRCNAAFAGRLATEAVNLVWDAGGGAGIYDSNPMSRLFRDASAANRHITQNWDANAATHGRVLLGLPLDNPSL